MFIFSRFNIDELRKFAMNQPFKSGRSEVSYFAQTAKSMIPKQHLVHAFIFVITFLKLQ